MSTQIKLTPEMVTRFLGWRLPAGFAPDCGISFTEIPGSWPTGTNLFSAEQAEQMLKHVLLEPSEQAPEVPTVTAEEVLATVGYDGFVRSLFNRSGDPSKDFAHAILGIVTEQHEFEEATDAVNFLEEAGDLTFYYFAAGQVVQEALGVADGAEFDAEEAATRTRLEFVSRRLIRAELNELLDIAKRWVGYGRQPKLTSGALLGRIGAIVAVILQSGPAEAQDHPRVLRANVDKLLERYKGLTFNADHAINRNVATERQVLENAAA